MSLSWHTPARPSLIAVFAVAMLAVPGRLPALDAQEPGTPFSPFAAEPGSELTIFHVTMGPGDMVWEKFEHNALWVRDAARGTDDVYNYGMFDFEEPGYWGRFVQGYWRYWVDVTDIQRTVYVYQHLLNRSVTVQELNLTPAQRLSLRDFLEWNARPENRYYYYDYYYDNCSTRIRDAIDRGLGGQLRAATQDSLTGKSFRWHSDRLVADDPAILTGLRLGLGPGADREITAWEEMFLPGKVHEQLNRLQVRDESGNLVPLVRQELVLYQAVGRPPLPDSPPSLVGWFLVIGIAIGGIFVALATWSPRARAARFAFAGTTALWTAFVGTGGLLLAFLWAFTNHSIAYRNENLLQLNPLALTLVVLVPALAFGARWAARPAVWMSALIAGLAVLGLLLKALPWFTQVNGAVIALALPAHLGLAWAAYRLAGRFAEPAAPAPAKPAAPPARPRKRQGAGA
jgi:hypothetical protein